MSRNPKEVLDDIAERAVLSMHGLGCIPKKPGAFIEKMSNDTRAVLRELKSDGLLDVAPWVVRALVE